MEEKFDVDYFYPPRHLASKFPVGYKIPKKCCRTCARCWNDWMASEQHRFNGSPQFYCRTKAGYKTQKHCMLVLPNGICPDFKQPEQWPKWEDGTI